MPRMKNADFVKLVLNQLNIPFDDLQIESVLKNLTKSEAKHSAEVSLEDYMANPVSSYALRLNTETPFSILRELYASNPNAFAQAFRVVRTRERKTKSTVA